VVTPADGYPRLPKAMVQIPDAGASPAGEPMLGSATFAELLIEAARQSISGIHRVRKGRASMRNP